MDCHWTFEIWSAGGLEIARSDFGPSEDQIYWEIRSGLGNYGLGLF